MTQAQFAKAIDMDVDRFRRIESGRQEPTVSDLAALSRRVNISTLIDSFTDTSTNGIAEP